MTENEAIAGLKALADIPRDNEAVHGDADQMLLDFLRANGFAAVADAWEDLAVVVGGFWYA